MRLVLKDDLPFVTVTVAFKGMTTDMTQVLVDTGSASTILLADAVAAINILPLPEDRLYSIRGVGGSEAVFSRKVDYLQVGECRLPGFEIEVGGMDYGFEIDGILGMDFLTKAGTVIDLRKMEIQFR